jgi:polar amino acid transport system substrate-binding protein
MIAASHMTAKRQVMSSAINAPKTSDPRVADLVHAGRMRVGLFPPQYVKDAANGALKGVWVEIARALASRVGVEIVVLEKPTPSEVVDALNAAVCDVASLGFDPSRVGRVGGFSPPFMRVDYTFMLPAGSPIRCIADADQRGVRIAAVRDHASTLALGRTLQRAEQVSVDTADVAFELLRSGRVDAWASIRPALLDYSSHFSGARVLDDHYGANLPALVVAKGQDARLAYVSEFIEDAKASGLVQQAIERAGQVGYGLAA